jgi:hypothetical protein
MLLRVQRMSPTEVPFLNGLSYAPIPRLLIPRFIDDQKGISHAGNILLSVNYGLQTIEDTRGTSIGWGLVPEAYANFGYIGVAGLAVALALFYGYFTNLTVGVPMTSLRFVLGLLLMGAATTADTMGVFVTTQFQGIAGVTLASFFLMRWQANPFAEGQEAWSGEQGAGKWGSAYARGGYGGTSGMPAPGVLAGLIEGSAQRRMGSLEVVPSASGKTAMRPTAWMPRSLRMRIIAEQREQAALAAQAAAAAPSTTAASEASQRPRQVAVPYRNYRRYKG